MGFDQVGRDISNGIAQGILDGTHAVISAVRSVISQALAAARSEADAHSPARAFIPLGEDIDAGVAVGMAKLGISSEAAAELVRSAQAEAHSVQAAMGTAYSSSVVNNTQTTRTGGDIIFGKDSIRVEGAPISSELDAKKVGRIIGTEAAKIARQKGVLAPA